MNLTSMLSMLGSLAKSLAPALIPGAANLTALVAAGKSVMDAFTSLKTANNGEAPADAEEAHQALVAKVNAHAEGTFDRAEGEG